MDEKGRGKQLISWRDIGIKGNNNERERKTEKKRNALERRQKFQNMRKGKRGRGRQKDKKDRE